LNRWAALTVCAGLVQAGVAAAAPCVSEAFDQPMPGATSVVTRRADVPSPQFPGLWQEGVFGGYFYALFANGEGALQAAPDSPEWVITFVCDEFAKTCERVQEGGEPPPDTAALVDRLERCFISPETAGEPIAPPAPPPVVEAPITEVAPVAPVPEASVDTPMPDAPLPMVVVPEPDTAPTPAEAPPPPSTEAPVEAAAPAAEKPVETVAPEADPAPVTVVAVQEPPPCGLATLPQGPDGITLQRLVVLAGANPGPIDGFPGKRTRAAIIELLGERGATLPVDEAIIALDQLVCAPKTE
jgi:hypothetical protein